MPLARLERSDYTFWFRNVPERSFCSLAPGMSRAVQSMILRLVQGPRFYIVCLLAGPPLYQTRPQVGRCLLRLLEGFLGQEEPLGLRLSTIFHSIGECLLFRLE